MRLSELSEEQRLAKCKEALDYFNVDYSGNVIWLGSGDLSCIMNSKSPFYELFGGYSIWNIATIVAKILNKEIKFRSEEYCESDF